jgi:hypothetical protein
MRGKPFQSKLEPHYDLIREARRKRQTWQAIVELLATQGVTTSGPAVYAFTKRRAKRRYAFGMAPDGPLLPAVTAATVHPPSPSETSNLSNELPPPSEFEADPLTLPPKVKTKSLWTVLKPNQNPK